jgi:hypothetical protein
LSRNIEDATADAALANGAPLHLREGAGAGAGAGASQPPRSVRVTPERQRTESRLASFAARLDEMDAWADGLGSELGQARGLLGAVEAHEQHESELEREAREALALRRRPASGGGVTGEGGGGGAVDVLLAEAEGDARDAAALAREAAELSAELELEGGGETLMSV